MSVHVPTTALWAMLFLASMVNAQKVPLDGISGLQKLPTTAKGQLFGACFNALLSSYGTSDNIIYDIRMNHTVAPLNVKLEGQFAEQVAVQLTGSEVDEFCAAATDPTMAQAVHGLQLSRGAAASKARAQWQQSSSKAAQAHMPYAGGSTGAAAAAAATQLPHPSTLMSVNSSVTTVGPKLVAGESEPASSKPASLSSAGTSLPGSPVATKLTGQAKPSAFSTPFTSDPTSGIWQPHTAEYSPVTGAYQVLLAPLTAAGLFPNNNGDTRSDAPRVATAVATCAALEVTAFVIDIVCGLTGTTGAWAGAAAVAAGGAWTAPAEIICLLGQAVTEGAFKLCNDVVTGSDFVDALIDAAEIQAAYENGLKALDNHLILWTKTNSDTVKVQQQISAVTTSIVSQVQRTEAALSKQTDAARTVLSNQIDATRTVLSNQGDATRTALSNQITALGASLTTQIAALSATVRELATVTSSQICDLKTDVAQVQREADYLRRLLLTPEGQRPGYKCPLLTASTTPKNKCDVRCPMTRPNACMAVDITTIVPARQLSPLDFCQ